VNFLYLLIAFFCNGKKCNLNFIVFRGVKDLLFKFNRNSNCDPVSVVFTGFVGFKGLSG
jgi:hypothetical protein